MSSTPLYSKLPAINTPKSGYTGSTAAAPGAFVIKTLKMTNSNNKTKDLQKFNLVESFTITSELFSPVLTLFLTIRDNQELFAEEFDICGQEKIEIEIEPKAILKSRPIKHTFFVKEYVNYTKTLDFPNTQIYSLIAISDFAYRSSLMNICRPVDSELTVPKNIENIFRNDLDIKEFVNNCNGDVTTQFEGIINIQRPLKAAEWLRSRCFDIDRYPCFLYSDATRESTIILDSWKNLINGAVVSTYKFRQHFVNNPGKTDHTKEEMSRILSMTSNIKFDRLGSANLGAYASRLNVTDYASKSYYTIDYRGNDTKTWKAQKYNVKNREGTKEEATMHNIPSANIETIQINTASSNDKFNSVTAGLYPNISRTNSFLAQLNEVSHEIIVYGDSALNAGVKVRLEVPKAMREGKKYEIDKRVSGEFIIAVSAHVFSNGVYKNKLKLISLGEKNNNSTSTK